MIKPLRRAALAAATVTALVFATAAVATPAIAATDISNGDFETGNLSGWAASGAATVTTSGTHSGAYAAQLGASPAPTNGDSSISQSFTAPTGATGLSFWYNITCPDTLTYDWATATLTDTTTGTTTTPLAKTCTNGQGWKQASATITAGHSYTLTLTSHDDNYTGDGTQTRYDDVTVTSAPPPPSGITNGGFEAGSLAGWTPSGTAAITTSGPHSGTYAAQLGASPTPTSGDSSIRQSFTAPSGATGLSFWYNVTCPDTVTYDWATATLTDTTTGTTTTPLARTCTNGQGWKQVSVAVTTGHSYTLTLISHDDNYTGDGTLTRYDDVALGGSTPADDFSIAASPSSGSVTAGGPTTSTISTVVTSGSTQTVTLSASGLPSGASASFNPPSVTTGGSSTMTIATASTAPNGTYTVTVTGTGISAVHTTTYTLTVTGGSGGLTLVSSDPYTNTSSQHATEVEPDTFSFGTTVVSSSQVGRFSDGGASNISWNTSTDGGATWQHGFLPGITVYQGGSWARVSDPSVAYDARDSTWMIAGLVLDANVNGAGVTVSRSSNGGTAWANPVTAIGNDGQGYDKEWIVCDNTPTSPFYGNCYIEVDVTSSGNRIIMSRSSDGGATWSAPVSPSGTPNGLGGQPLVQPSGTVVVPYSANGSAIRAFTSTNGGGSYNTSVLISSVSSHPVAGGLRDGEGLPSAEIDGAGMIYVAWQDCRFRSGCPANDIVYSTSTNGTTWSAVTRVPIDATTSGVDHFIPGIGVDKSTSGAGAHIGLYYYFYANAACTSSTCQLQVGFISSTNAGGTWSQPQTLAGPFPLSQIASTTQGSMVGDYISCSLAGGKAVAIFAVGRAPTGGAAFDEAMYSVGGLTVTGGAVSAERYAGMPAAPQASNRRYLRTY